MYDKLWSLNYYCYTALHTHTTVYGTVSSNVGYLKALKKSLNTEVSLIVGHSMQFSVRQHAYIVKFYWRNFVYNNRLFKRTTSKCFQSKEFVPRQSWAFIHRRNQTLFNVFHGRGLLEHSDQEINSKHNGLCFGKNTYFKTLHFERFYLRNELKMYLDKKLISRYSLHWHDE